MKISISILFGVLLALPAAMLTAQPEAQAQQRVSERSQSSNRSQKTSNRRTTTTTRSKTHIRNVRPNPNSRPVYRPHRPQVYVPPRRAYVYNPHRHRTRLHTRYHSNRVIVHHHHVETQPRVVVVEVERPQLPEISCDSRTLARSNEFEQWCETSRGVRHGTYIRRHSNGQIAMEGEYEYDQKEGLWTEWHSNGEPRLEGEYSNNERVGVWVRWDNRGQEVSVIDYR